MDDGYYSNHHIADIHFIYGFCNGSANAAVREYARRFPSRPTPNARTFVRIHMRLAENGIAKPVEERARLLSPQQMDADESEEENEDEEVESEEEKPKAKRGGRAAPKSRATKEKVTKKKNPGKTDTGFTRSYKLSPALAELMGSDEMPRQAVVKRVWTIVKENNLYDPNNKQFAICDDALYKVIGKQRFRLFGMMKYLKSHFLD